MKLNISNLMVLVAVAIAAMYAFGIISPLVNKYEEKLREDIAKSEAIIQSLEHNIVLLDIEKEVFRAKADSALAALGVEEEKRKQEKDAFDRKMAELNKLSTAELASYFTERYDSR